MVHSTLMAAALFLLVDAIIPAREGAGDILKPTRFTGNRAWLGAAFFVCAVAASGLPPLTGFLGKAMLLQASSQTPVGAWTWTILLISGLGTLIAVSRTGSLVFWRGEGARHGATDDMPDPVPAPAGSRSPAGLPARAAGIGLLVLLLPLVAVLGGPLQAYTAAAAAQLFEKRAYLSAVLDARPVPAAIDVRREMRERGEIKGIRAP